MRPIELRKVLAEAFRNNVRLLIKGKPGIGKSDVTGQAADDIGADLLLVHPALCDPTDNKGLPYPGADGKSAVFLPYGYMLRMINATKKLIVDFEDIGQASPAVQASLMQLILGRQVNDTKISDEVVFVGTTNETGQCAGVSGMIEPLKSRWHSIISLEVSVDDWTQWALGANMPPELIAFLRFRPALLSPDDWKPSKEIKNSPCPRTWAGIGRMLNVGMNNAELFQGAVGDGPAAEFLAFLKMYQKLPSLDAILLDPKGEIVPDDLGALYAVAGGLARKATPGNFHRVCQYIARLPKEHEILCVRDAAKLNPAVRNCTPFIEWTTRNSDILS